MGWPQLEHRQEAAQKEPQVRAEMQSCPRRTDAQAKGRSQHPHAWYAGRRWCLATTLPVQCLA